MKTRILVYPPGCLLAKCDQCWGTGVEASNATTVTYNCSRCRGVGYWVVPA